MPVFTHTYSRLQQELLPAEATLVAVSKTRPASDVQALYDLGHRDFGENYVQELLEKQGSLPKDIRWHFIGHLQTNKVKLIAPFIYLIQGVDSLKLLKEINKQGEKCQRQIQVLLQVHIAREESKFGLDEKELEEIMQHEAGRIQHVKVCGLMGMASFTQDLEVVEQEFRQLKNLFDRYADGKSRPGWKILSMGMSGDYRLALQNGSNMVRVGSLLFGERTNA